MIGTLTRRQGQVLDFIRWMIKERGWPPTFREICEHFGFATTNSAAGHLNALERKGFIVRDSITARAIRLTDAAQPKRGMPWIELAGLGTKQPPEAK